MKLKVMHEPMPIARLFLDGNKNTDAAAIASLSAPIVSGFPTGMVNGSKDSFVNL